MLSEILENEYNKSRNNYILWFYNDNLSINLKSRDYSSIGGDMIFTSFRSEGFRHGEIIEKYPSKLVYIRGKI